MVAGAGALPGAFRPAGGAHLPAGAAGAVVPAGEFRPHVTLARKVSFPGEAPGVEALLPQPLAALCGRVSLVRSQLTAAGALYNEVAGKNPPV